MDFARIYRTPTRLIAIPATEQGEHLAGQRGLKEAVFRGRPAPAVLVLAMLTQFGGDLLSDNGDLVRAFDREATLPATI